MRRRLPVLSRYARTGAEPSKLLCSILVLLALGSCTAYQERARRGRPGFTERGLASWYGPGFHGKLTANGEVYDMNALTAAHKHLPFGSIVEVRNRENGRTVRVRINDRGPFVRGRIIDLSKAAALQIDLVRTGVAEVTVRVVRTSSAAAAPDAGRRWLVQVGAFRERHGAERQLELVAKHDRRARLMQDGDLFRIVIGPISDKRAVQRVVADLERRGFQAFARQVSPRS